MFVKRLGDVYCVLTGHCIDDKQNFGGLNRFLYFDKLVHQRFVDMRSARRIDNNRIVAFAFGIFYCLFCRFNRRLRSFFKDFGTHATTDNFKLIDCGGTINIACAKHGLFALLDQVLSKFAAHGGFSRALQTAHHDNSGRLGAYFQFGIGATHKRDKLVVYYFNDLLTGRKTFQDIFADGFVAYRSDKLLDDAEIDVCLEQRNADFAHGLLDILFGQTTF